MYACKLFIVQNVRKNTIDELVQSELITFKDFFLCKLVSSLLRMLTNSLSLISLVQINLNINFTSMVIKNFQTYKI